MIAEGLTYLRFGWPEKEFSINFVWVCVIMLIIIICLLMEKKSLILKPKKEINFPTQFCLGSMPNEFSTTEFKEVSLKGNVYHFSVNYSFIDKTDILGRV